MTNSITGAIIPSDEGLGACDNRGHRFGPHPDLTTCVRWYPFQFAPSTEVGATKDQPTDLRPGTGGAERRGPNEYR